MNQNDIESRIEDAVEVAEKETKKNLLSDIESKSLFVKAYENGPVLADSLIITMDDWLEIKSGRKSSVSYKLTTPSLNTFLEEKLKEFNKKFGNYDNSMFNVWKIGDAKTSEITFEQLKDFISASISEAWTLSIKSTGGQQ